MERKMKLVSTLKAWKVYLLLVLTISIKHKLLLVELILKDIHYDTLESKLVPNLYFCGEIDVHGDCGGFNLQWAWSSGYTVATSLQKRK